MRAGLRDELRDGLRDEIPRLVARATLRSQPGGTAGSPQATDLYEADLYYPLLTLCVCPAVITYMY